MKIDENIKLNLLSALKKLNMKKNGSLRPEDIICSGNMIISEDNRVFLFYDCDGEVATKYFNNDDNIFKQFRIIKSTIIDDIDNEDLVNQTFDKIDIDNLALFNINNIFIDADNSEYEVVDGCLIDKCGTVIQGSNACESIVSSKIKNIEYASFIGLNIQKLNVTSNIRNIAPASFFMCSKLVDVNLPDSAIIQDDVFAGCTSLKNINIPSSTTIIRCDTFECCINLETIKLHTDIKEIQNKSFMNCQKLKNIEGLNDNIIVDSMAFECCEELKKERE